MIDKENVFRRLGIHSKGGTYNVMFLVINIRYYQWLSPQHQEWVKDVIIKRFQENRDE